MTATLSMVPLAQIRPSEANPRTEFDDERMAELIESVKRHGIITPLTLSRDGDGRYAIIAGERRYRAAKAAKLREVPAQVREVDGEALTLAVAENVIRADLSPLEEARAYRRLVDEHGDAAKVAKLVGKSERLISERLDLLRLPDETQELLAARRVPLACAPVLVRIAEREPLLADLTAAWLAERPHDAAGFPAAPGEVVDDVLAAEWPDDDGKPLHPVAYSVGGYHGPILPRGQRARTRLAAVLAKLGDARARRSRPPTARCPRSSTRPSTTGRPAQTRGAPRARLLRPQRRRRRRRARVRLPARTPRPERTASTATSPTRVARGSARAEDRRPRRGRGGAQASSATPAAPSARRTTTRRRRRRREQRSATTRRACRPARATSTSARRSPAGSRSSTPTRSSCSARSCSLHTARRPPGRTGSASSSRPRRTSRAR